MHGGKGSGAPKGNGNARKHGLYTAAMRQQAATIRSVLRRAERLLRD